MKYLIEPRRLKNLGYPICSAGGDASTILTAQGYEPFYIGHPSTKNKLVKYFLTVCDYAHLAVKLKKNDTVFLQWPFSGAGASLLYKLILPPRVKDLKVLVHDIDSLRYGKPLNDLEKQVFSKATTLILHSEQMKKYVVDCGIDGSKVRLLQCFDYLTKDEIKEGRKNSNMVVAVATTERSPFLKLISEADLGIHINLYGKRCEGYDTILGKDITHKGTFKSDNVSALEGSWGLVWDGESVDTCNKAIGEYMRYNSPHKVSLFIAAHMPIIIWDQAAKAEYVKEKGLGICVSSLREVSDRIKNISDEEYEQIIRNLEKESKKVRNGHQLKSCLK